MYTKLKLSKAKEHVWDAICEVWFETEFWDIDTGANSDFTSCVCSLWKIHTYLEMATKYNLKKYHEDIKQKLCEEMESYDDSMTRLLDNHLCNALTTALKIVELNTAKFRRTLKLPPRQK